MKARAIQRHIHLSPRKAKLVCDLIRNKSATVAINILENTRKKAAPIVLKLLHSAIANATNNHALSGDKLYVYHIVANQGQTLKRTNPRAKGSADLLKKRHCHIEIILSDDPNERAKDIALIKERQAKRAKNNKGYSAKQRAGKVEKKKREDKPVVKKPAPAKKPEPKKVEQKPVVERKVSAEALKREQEQLKVVETKPVEKTVDKKNIKPVEVEKTAIIMISASPKHADILLDDPNKKVFFYKVTPVNKVKRVLIYATAPVQGVIGEFDLEKIDIKAVSTIWKNYGASSVLTKKEYDEYYKDKKEAHAMISKEAFRYSKPKKLEDFNMKKGPSGFQYLK